VCRDKVKANSNPANKKEWESEMATVTKVKEYLESGKDVRTGVGVGDADVWNAKGRNSQKKKSQRPFVY
jgi:hypothetical protein